MLEKTYSWHRLFWTKPIPNMLVTTYSWHRLLWTKPIPGIGYAEQNFIWDSVVKICKTGSFADEKNNFRQ